MDWLTFIDHLVQALAWPLAIVVTVIILRRPLTHILDALHPDKLKYGDMELSFWRKDLAQATESAELLSETPVLSAEENQATVNKQGWSGSAPSKRTKSGTNGASAAGTGVPAALSEGTPDTREQEQLQRLSRALLERADLEREMQELRVKVESTLEELAATEGELSRRRSESEALYVERQRVDQLRMELEAKERAVQQEIARLRDLERSRALTAPEARDRFRVRREIEKLALQEPQLAVLEAWDQIQTAISDAIVRVGLQKGTAQPTPLFGRLLRAGYLDPHTFNLINDLRELRNKVAHQKDAPQLTPSDAREYAATAWLLIDRLNAIEKPDSTATDAREPQQ